MIAGHQGVVDNPGGNPGGLGGSFGRHALAPSLPKQGLGEPNGVPDVSAIAWDRAEAPPRPFHDHHHFTLQLAVLNLSHHVREKPTNHLLVEFGELTGDRHSPLPRHRQKVGQRGAQPSGRLEQDHRSTLSGQGGDPVPAGPAGPGEESFEHEPVRGQAGEHQRRDHRGRPGGRVDRNAGVHTCDHQPVSGIRDGRHPCLGHDRHIGAGQKLLDQLRHPFLFVAFEERDQAGTSTDQLKEAAGPPRVLRGHHVHL